MQVEITNAEYGSKLVTKHDDTFAQIRTGVAVARVTIDGETREFTAKLFQYHGDNETWYVDGGIGAVYPTGSKVHNSGFYVDVSPRGTSLSLAIGRSSMFARRKPRAVGFFNEGANAASPKYRR